MAELEAADLRFMKDQQRQLEEVSLLVQRIENQVKIMQEAYRRELQLIEVVNLKLTMKCFPENQQTEKSIIRYFMVFPYILGSHRQ